MPEFLVNTHISGATRDKLYELLKVDGNLLVLAYGFLTGAEDFWVFAQHMSIWLSSNPKRRIAILVGVHEIGSTSDQTNARLTTGLVKLFTEDLFSPDQLTRVELFVVPRYHAKTACMATGDTKSFRANAALFGSSNLTSAAIHERQFELDIWIGPGDSPDLINDFSTSFSQLWAEALAERNKVTEAAVWTNFLSKHGTDYAKFVIANASRQKQEDEEGAAIEAAENKRIQTLREQEEMDKEARRESAMRQNIFGNYDYDDDD